MPGWTPGSLGAASRVWGTQQGRRNLGARGRPSSGGDVSSFQLRTTARPGQMGATVAGAAVDAGERPSQTCRQDNWLLTSLPGRGSPFLPQDTGQGPANGLEASGRRLGSLTSPAPCPSPRRRTPGGPSIIWAGPFERRRSRELPGLGKARSWGSRRPPGRRAPRT